MKIKTFISKHDKLSHFIAGCLIALITWLLIIQVDYIVLYTPTLTAMTIGFVKEYIDNWKGGKFDWKDFFATFAGGGLTNLILILI